MTLPVMLDKLVKVRSLTVTGSGGARKKNWSTVKYPKLPAAIQPRSATNAKLFKESGMQITHVIYVGDPSGGYGTVFDMEIGQEDQIEDISPTSTAGRVFEVVGVMDQCEAGECFRCGCVERKG